MVGLGLSGTGRPPSEIRIGFRSGWVRFLGITVGGAGAVGAGIGVLDLAQRQPAQFFELLSRWGFAWLLALAALAFAWDLAKSGLGYLGKLADSVQESAVAMNRIADRDDRDRDRMITETSFIGQRMEKLSTEMRDSRAEQKAHNERVEALIQRLMK
jgi:hypothetical protein